jgi:hypothetical protein
MPSNARNGVEFTPLPTRLFPHRGEGIEYFRGVSYHLSHPPGFTEAEWESRISRLAERAEQELPLFVDLTEGGGLAR